MLDDVRIQVVAPAQRGDDRSAPPGLPPDAPLAMPPQVLERRARPAWWRLLAPAPA